MTESGAGSAAVDVHTCGAGSTTLVHSDLQGLWVCARGNAEDQVGDERSPPRAAQTEPGAEERRRWGQPGGGCVRVIIPQDPFGDTDPDLGRDSKAGGGGAPGPPVAGLAPPLPSFPPKRVDLK